MSSKYQLSWVLKRETQFNSTNKLSEIFVWFSGGSVEQNSDLMKLILFSFVICRFQNRIIFV